MSRSKMASVSFSYNTEDEGQERPRDNEDETDEKLPFWCFREELHASGHNGEVACCI